MGLPRVGLDLATKQQHIISDVEHLFMCLLAVCLMWRNGYLGLLTISFFPHFLIGLFCFVIECMSRLYMCKSVCLTLCDPMDYTRLLCPWNSPGKNTGVGYHALLQGIFPTQGSNLSLLSLLHWQAGFFTTSATWEACVCVYFRIKLGAEHLRRWVPGLSQGEPSQSREGLLWCCLRWPGSPASHSLGPTDLALQASSSVSW